MKPKKIFKVRTKLMGNQFEISVVATEEDRAIKRINEAVDEIKRIEKRLTTFSDSSETNLINQNAGIAPVAVSDETYQLIERSIRISALTQGAFDITYGSIDKSLWNFDSTMNALPDKGTAKQMVKLINYRNIMLDKEKGTVFLKEAGTRIGFGGIGKGYAAEMAKKIMIQNGVQSGIVNASGDLTAWGLQPNGEEWTIGIADPNIVGQVFSFIKITGLAVATSGNYEKFILIDGKKYSHTINPRTGLPVTGIKSVTIITTNAEIADAMATPVTIMGVKAGLGMINQIKDIEAIIVDDHDKVYTSTNIHIN
ncbi:FAD:protein FMN transferase [Ferruginibacter sp.]|uniref:FAD:protein FMN transferase n=1 Tax=Ferruginibacter sp. TaxID=1940288 RepID=UPI0019890202|nr:FAD:protein FMN transferase [Ferruginibacter sp.]MBC7627160.1 FAD:protein FMN transferase [Ferruginibacter sp.]